MFEHNALLQCGGQPSFVTNLVIDCGDFTCGERIAKSKNPNRPGREYFKEIVPYIACAGAPATNGMTLGSRSLWRSARAKAQEAAVETLPDDFDNLHLRGFRMERIE
jgi:hypothetical protein